MVAEMEILVRTALTVCLLPNILLCIFGMTGKMTLLGDILALLRCILPRQGSEVPQPVKSVCGGRFSE